MKKEVKFCKDCGVCLGTIYSLGQHRFNAIQRCETCQKLHRKQQKAEYQREYRRDGRTVRRLPNSSGTFWTLPLKETA